MWHVRLCCDENHFPVSPRSHQKFVLGAKVWILPPVEEKNDGGACHLEQKPRQQQITNRPINHNDVGRRRPTKDPQLKDNQAASTFSDFLPPSLPHPNPKKQAVRPTHKLRPKKKTLQSRKRNHKQKTSSTASSSTLYLRRHSAKNKIYKRKQ